MSKSTMAVALTAIARGELDMDIDELLDIQLGDEHKSRSRSKRIEASLNSAISFSNAIAETLVALMSEISEGTENSLSGLVNITELKNYLLHDVFETNSQPAMQDLPRGGSAKSISFTLELIGQFRGIRKALTGFMDEQDIGNLLQILRVNSRVGQIAAQNFYQDMLWRIPLANEEMASGNSLFSAANGNDANLALDATNLAAGIASMASQKDGTEYTGHQAKAVIVAPELYYVARQLARAIKLDDGSDLIVRAEPRIGSGMVDPITGLTIAGNPSRWFLLDGNLPAITVALLTPKPHVTTWKKNGEDGIYGVGWSIEWSIGSAVSNHRSVFRRQAP